MNFLRLNELFSLLLYLVKDFYIPIAQVVKNLPAVQETWIRSLGQEDPLEKGNGNSLQYSCLENSMAQGAWWATLHGVAKSWTRLNDFTSPHFKSKPVY